MKSEEWLSILDMSEATNIPHQSLRRYMQVHRKFLTIKRNGRAYQIHVDDKATLLDIREMYLEGKGTDDINQILSESGNPITIEVKDEGNSKKKVSVNEVVEDIYKKLDKQERVNEILVQLLEQQNRKLDAQQKFIEEKFSEQEQLLLESKEEPEEVAEEPEPVIEEKKGFFARLFK